VNGESKPLIVAASLTREYTLGETRVVGVDRIDWSVTAGELVVVKGNSGSGKSTLLSLLAGLDRPTGGRLTVSGWDVSRLSDKHLTQYRRKTVGMVFQSFNLMPTLNVMENVCLPALLAGEPYDAIRKRADGHLRRLGMERRFDHLPSQLSGGEMQRTAIARALINDPAIVLADEPTGNLDSRNGSVVMELLADLHRADGRTVIIATHSDMADAHATVEVELKDGGIV
jgi:putative ABC transport system ATP-binding protein